ncbi:MAG: hypothetical protein QW265_00090 [Candidatus Bathyarchaeia archaeon]
MSFFITYQILIWIRWLDVPFKENGCRLHFNRFNCFTIAVPKVEEFNKKAYRSCQKGVDIEEEKAEMKERKASPGTTLEKAELLVIKR